jgi:hypothetical protein
MQTDGLGQGILEDDTIKHIPEMPIYEQKKISTRKGWITVEIWEI